LTLGLILAGCRNQERCSRGHVVAADQVHDFGWFSKRRD